MFPLALALLMVGAAPPAAAGSSTAAPPAIQAQQSASGVILAEDLAGHIAVFDSTQRVVFEMDKESGRPIRVGVAPGTYEVRLQTRRSAVRITVQVRDGEYTVVDADRFAQPSTGGSEAAGAAAPAAEPSPRGSPGRRGQPHRGPLRCLPDAVVPHRGDGERHPHAPGGHGPRLRVSALRRPRHRHRCVRVVPGSERYGLDRPGSRQRRRR